MRECRGCVIGYDGHIQQRFEFCCTDDEEAKDRAKQYVDGHDVELWHAQRSQNLKASSKVASDGAHSF
jgi:hypothetical protein